MSYWSKEVFDTAEESAPVSEYAVLPEGEYHVQLVDCELKETKAGTGHYLNCRFDVCKGDATGRVLWMAINVNNPNPRATGIGIGQLRDLSYAAKKEVWYEKLKSCQTWVDAEQHLNSLFNTVANIPVKAKVKVEKSDKYGDKNIIKGFKVADTIVPGVGKSPKKESPFS